MKNTIKLTALCLIGLMTFSLATVIAGEYKPGDKARDFKLKNVDGKMVSMADNKEAKGYIIVFTCNHCPFSKAYEQRILELDKMYAASGYPVIAINPNDKTVEPDDSYDNMIALAKEKNYSFPYLYDEKQEIAKAYGATRTPHVFVVQKTTTGNVVKYVGAIDDNADDVDAVKNKYVQDAVNALLGGNPVTIAATKAIGCTIKWKKQ